MDTTKTLRGVEVKDAVKGEVKAIFATFNEIDHDGDVTLPGFFEDGQKIRISAYNHTSWQGALPVGKGVIRVTDTHAILEGQFFMNIPAAADTFKTVKEMGELQEWSYGFDIRPGGSRWGEFNGRRVQFLQALEDGSPGGDVHEASPVLRGAGRSTATLEAKSHRETGGAHSAIKRAIPVHESAVVSQSWDCLKMSDALPADARPSQLRTVYAWVDPDGDPEALTSYKLAHHHGIGGPANVRACLAGIASLNSGDAEIPDADRKAVYDHLAAHVRDADREPPQLRSRGSKAEKFADQLLEGLAGLSGLIDGAARVVALRAEKGKTLSKANGEYLDWIADDLKRLDALLRHPPAGAVPDDEIASVLLASMAALHDL